jgi:hypothetical protein
MAETIYFNGKKYRSLAEMPPNERQMYEKFNRFFADADQDGVPDVLQAGGLSGLKETFGMIKDIAQMGSTTQGLTQGQLTIVRETDTGIFVNGKSFNSAAEMPADIRRIYEQVTSSSREGDVDIFDESWRQTDRDDYFKPHDDEIINREFTQPPVEAPASVEVVDSNARLVLIIIVALALIGGLVFAWMYFF